MAVRIKLASSGAGLGWWLGIEATLDGSSYNAHTIILSVTAVSTGTTVVRAQLARDIEFPDSLVDVDGSGELSLKPPDAGDLDDLKKALLVELHRRLATQEIVWSQSDSNRTFLKLSQGLNVDAAGNFSGSAHVYPANVLEPGNPVLAEFSARGALQMTVDALDPANNTIQVAASRVFTIAVVIYKDAIPKLRVDFDDFNIGFPEIEFPDIDLSVLRKLKWPDLSAGVAGVSRVFRRLASAVQVTVKTTATEPTLRIDPTGPGLKWCLAETSLDNAPPAKFDVTITEPGNAFTVSITGLSAEGTGAGGRLTGMVTASGKTLPQKGQRKFGPLIVRWEGVTLAPTATAANIQHLDRITLRGLVHFDRVMIYAADDPSAVIALSGDVEITPSGVRVLALDLIEPYPIKLIANARDALEQAASNILRFLAELKPPSFPATPNFMEGLRKLFDVLGRLAAAIGRAGVFIGEAVGAGAELIGKALHGIAEAIGRLISALAELLADAAKAAHRYLAFEVRIASDAFEIRQVLVTLRNDPAVPSLDRVSALGFDLEIPTGWEPGLLLDFVAAPGAYLIATRQEGITSEPFATLSTDLWLKRGSDPVQPMRDAHGTSGERGQSAQGGKPLLSVAATLKKPGEFALILAGLRSGQGVFFQKITNVERKQVVGVPGVSLVTANGAFTYAELDPNTEFDVDVEFEKDRVLPLLGMGEPGKEGSNPPAPGASQPGFLDRLKSSLSQTVWVKRFEKAVKAADLTAEATLVLGVKAAGVETEIKLKLALQLRTFEVKIDAAAGPLSLKSRRIEERALGLVWVVEQRDPDDRKINAEIDMFRLSFENGETSLKLNDDPKNGARMEVRFTELSSDGRGVVLNVESFGISRAGLDLTAKASGEPVRLNGLNVPFEFTTGEFVIRGGRVNRAVIGGRGSLPRDLVGEVDCAVLLDFKQDAASNEIVLQSGKVEFGKKGEPIVCHSTRFTLTINDLDISFARDGGYHFYFLVTGALEFTPRDGEFESGLLQYLKDVRIELERAPLTADPRVLLKHVKFQKSLNPKKTFPLFNLFQFELRGFGFHPASPKFSGSPPAVNISGQIKFAQIGDVMQPSIEFHGLWIAPPEAGKSLPRLKADGLGVDIGLSGVAKLRGSVLAVDPQTPSLEGLELAPPGYDAYGFLGEGQLSIEGWGTMSAAMGFMEVARKDAPDDRKKSFFLYLEANKLAIEIPVVIWTFYLREVGFGFGYRYTLRGIKAAEQAQSVAQLVKTLDDVSKRQGDLSRFTSWLPDPEGDNVTLALRGAFQCYPAEDSWNEKQESVAEEPFFFDIVAALRSDMTFLMAARGWVATNYHDFLNDKSGEIRHHPGFRGYLYISAPRMELLARCIGDSTGYVGDRLGNIETLKTALKSVDWSMTLYINPRLFHLELGWPNELVARLRDDPNFRVIVRGGMIFRVSEDGILWGYNIEADAFIAFSGSVGGGSLGVAIEASLAVKFVARLIAFLSWRVKGTLIYGLISLDVNLSFRVRAWMEIDLGITSFTIRISFSFHVQFSAAVELAISTEGVGARVVAPIAVPAFGCMLWVTVTFVIGGSKLEEARARVQRFMSLGITNESTPDPVKSVAIGIGDNQVQKGAQQAEKAATAPVVPTPSAQGTDVKPPTSRSALGNPIEETKFWLVLHAADGPDDFAYALLVPKEPIQKSAGPPPTYLGGFYSSPCGVDPTKPRTQAETALSHTLSFAAGADLPDPAKVKRWDAVTRTFEDFNGAAEVKTRWDVAIPADTPQPSGGVTFALAHLFDECFLYDAHWPAAGTRETTAWQEPPPLRHARTQEPAGPHEDERRRERDNAQRDRAASAASNPLVTNVYQARSTVLSMFLDQFVTLAKDNGKRSDMNAAHVTDLGLVFRGPAGELAKFAKLNVKKVDAAASGGVEVFNPRNTWFDLQDPVLQKTKEPKVDAAGVKIDWRLRVPFVTDEDIAKATDPHDPKLDAEQFLHHYEIVAEIDDRPRWDTPKLIKPAPSQGGVDKDGIAQTLRPDWQFVDDLSDLPDALRRALLPATGEEKALEAAAAWVNSFGDQQEVTLTYSIIPVDIAGTKGTERSFIVEVPRPQAPIRPAEAELRFFLQPPHAAQFAAKRPDNLGIALALRDTAWDDDRTDLGNDLYAVRKYRLIVDPEEVVPSGNYGSDGLTDRLKAPHSGTNPSRSGDEVEFIFERSKIKTCKYDDDGPALMIEPDGEARQRFTDGFLRLAGTPVPSTLKDALLPVEETDPKKKGNDQKTLFDVLWGRDAADPAQPRRAASRFYLETLVAIVDAKGNPATQKPFVSRRVPVNFEIFIANAEPAKDGDKTDPVLLRPDAFEWPVRLDLPALGRGQVRAATGFAMFRVPGEQATLAEVVARKDAVAQIRDPDRRVLTMVEWDAVPDWAIPAAAPDPADGADIEGVASGGALPAPTPLPDKLHAATLGGFDLHELDIDDLAAIDTRTRTVKDKGPVPFSRNAPAWRRARRVARVQLLPGSAAMLVPHANDDLLGWHAHYPSETWRILNRQVGAKSGEHKPIKSGWWSAREATPRFPDRIVRHRLLPLSDENTSSALMLNGPPRDIYVRIDMVPKSDAEATIIAAEVPGPTVREIKLADIRVTFEESGVFKAGPSLADRFNPPAVVDAGKWVGWTRITLKSGEQFKPVDLRALQLCLAWKPGELVGNQLTANRAALDGLILKFAGEFTVTRDVYSEAGGKLVKGTGPNTIDTGRIDVPLYFATPLHPALEEALAELELAERVDGSTRVVYRRYNPVVQPAPRVDAKDLAGFLAATAAAKDPYGWGVLQSLGLSVTLRLFDGDVDAFVAPEKLLAHVSNVMGGIIARYKALMTADDFRKALGAPFAEVLLRPGKDRVPAPFEAKVSRQASRFEFDDALAMVQLSLRPRVQPAWTYHRLTGSWNKALQPPALSDGEGKFDAGVVFTLAPDTLATIDVLRPADSRALEVTPAPLPQPGSDANKKPTLPSIGQPVEAKDKSKIDPNLTLVVRVRRDFDSAAALPSFVNLGVIKRSRKIVTPPPPPPPAPPLPPKIVDTDTVEEATSLGDWIVHPGAAGTDPGFGTAAIAFPGADTSVDPFERFEPKNVQQWCEALVGGVIKDASGADKRIDPAVDAFTALQHAVQGALPDVKWPMTVPGTEPSDEIKSAIAVYLDWTQRFLDHGTSAVDPESYEPTLHVAFAAPSKATPWRLAAALDGTLSVSFLHNDRWGHARAYAVKPFGRYQELMIGAGAFGGDRGDARERVEQLISGEEAALERALGYAVAVSPRTERIEAPVILGSRIIAETGGAPGAGKHNGEWQLVVPRHNEESLAFSNRPLFARLGWQGVALSFVRDYREPQWPDRLTSVMGAGAPKPQMHPAKGPPDAFVSPSNATPAISGGDLAGIAQEFPSLWKGADIYRFARLPHYYRVSVLATARAGIAVSPLALNVQDDFTASMPGDADFATIVTDRGGATAIVMDPDIERAALQITTPLLSHYDLMDAATRATWIGTAGTIDDVTWWPDPEAVYAFRRLVGSAGSQVLEEEAELRLVARAAPDATPTDTRPLIVRARGTRFKAASADPVVSQVITSENGVQKRQFATTLRLLLAPKASPLATAALDPATTSAEIQAFNGDPKAQRFAAIATGFELTIDLQPQPGHSVDQTVDVIGQLAAMLVMASDTDVPDPGRARAVLGPPGRKALEWVALYRAGKLPTMPATPAAAIADSGLSNLKFQIAWPDGRPFPLAVGTAPAQNCSLVASAAPPPYLALVDYPTKAERQALTAAPAILAALDRAIAVARQTAIAGKQLAATVTDADITAFNTQADTNRYARIFSRHGLTVDLVAKAAETVADFVDRLDLLAKALAQAAATVPATDPSNVANFLAGRARALAAKVVVFKATPPASTDKAREDAGLPQTVPVWWAPGVPFVLDTTAGTPTENCAFAMLSGDDREVYLALFDLPLDSEIAVLTTVADIADVLKRLARDLVAAGAVNLDLRVVHPRAGDAGGVGAANAVLKWSGYFPAQSNGA
jgi:hypothetical protein